MAELQEIVRTFVIHAEINFQTIEKVLAQIVDQDDEAIVAFRACIDKQKELVQLLNDATAKKEKLEQELAARQKTLNIRCKQFEETKLIVRRERMQTKLREQKLSSLKNSTNEFYNFLDTLPANLKKEITSKLSAPLPSSLPSSSFSLNSVSSTSIPSETSSSNFSLCLNANNYFAERTTTNGNSNGKSLLNVLETDLSLEGGPSSSTEVSSDRSSVMMFPSLMDNIRNRAHALTQRIFIMGNKCNVCHVKIGCGKKGFHCNDCHADSHINCSEKMAEPCIPTITYRKENVPSSISDYCSPKFKPMIPALVLHCIFEVEKRGMNEAGLYKVSEYSRKFLELQNWCRQGNGIPNLSNLKINLVCELLKHFLSSLRPRLIGESEFQFMMQQVVDENGKPCTGISSALDHAIIFNSLVRISSTSSRNTFIFMILHLQNISENTACKMSARSLSKVFTPILVENYENESYEKDKKKWSIIEYLIKINSCHWKSNFMQFLY